MQDLLQKFFAHPGPRNYLRVRERLLSRRRGRARPMQLVNLVELFKGGSYQQVRRAIDEMMPAWALSPAVYWLGACAARELDDACEAEVDRFAYHACIQGIMATGAGSEDRPFLITYSSDIDEVLYQMKRVRQRLELQRGKRGLCDVAWCPSGEPFWFSLGEGIRHEYLHVPAPSASFLVR